MNKFCNISFTIAVALINYTIPAFAQVTDTSKNIIRAAGPEYNRPPFYQSFWGRNYRKEWTTPVAFPVMMLDTAFGGLKPYKQGGGNQSKSLHLKTKDDKLYAMRSVNKTLKILVPKIFHNTFIEDIANDEISMSHPYGALSVPLMANAAGIYHTNPKYVYVPEQPALDTFNKVFANNLYLLEERPDDDWSNAPNLGNFKKFYDSEDVREKLYENNDRQVDQVAFAKARIFDMFIGDWDRHQDQWKWGEIEKDKKTYYVPVPVDRDQVYSKYDGLLLKMVISAAGMKYFQSFDYDIPYPEGYSYEKRNVDRFFTNSLTLIEWQNVAKELQQSLTDSVIEKSIRQMPPEIFAISGNDIIAKLKSRRSHLEEYATKYYLFLSKNVDIVGSQEREHFEVKHLNDKETEVNIFDLEEKENDKQLFYSRKFNANETNEIRLYGLSGKDTYSVDGKFNNGIKLRIISGDDIDSILLAGNGKKVHVYDNPKKNIIQPKSKARLHLSSDSMVHAFDYDAFIPGKRGIRPSIGFNSEDRLYVGIGYGWLHQSFRKKPFSSLQNVLVNYSISQKAFSTTYTGLFPKTVGNWNLLLKGNYDAVRWTQFFGLGNETLNQVDDIDYYRMRSAQWLGSIGLNRLIGKSNITVSGFYNSVNILNDTNRFLAKQYLPFNPEKFRTNSFIGGMLNYNITSVNDSIVPEKGIVFSANAGYTYNTKDDNRSFASFGGDVQMYIPLVKKISLAISTGSATVTGTPEFYQYATIGGANSLRGYRTGRFSGKTAFYNSNEIRFITNIRSYYMNGKVGLLAFFDEGRVWLPTEKSNTWHTNYGGGILLVPFKLIYVDVTYGISNDDKLIQLRVRGKLFAN